MLHTWEGLKFLPGNQRENMCQKGRIKNVKMMNICIPENQRENTCQKGRIENVNICMPDYQRENTCQKGRI